jgi:hypothetical protein
LSDPHLQQTKHLLLQLQLKGKWGMIKMPHLDFLGSMGLGMLILVSLRWQKKAFLNLLQNLRDHREWQQSWSQHRHHTQ